MNIDGNTLINLSLPPEVAQAFLDCVEQSLAQFEVSDASMPQRRADATVLMNGEDILETQKKWGNPANSHTGADTCHHSTHVDHSLCGQCSTASEDPTHANWPGVAEAAGCYLAGATC